MMTISSKLIRSFFTKWKDMEHCPRRVYHEVVLREKEPDPYKDYFLKRCTGCLLYTSPSPRDGATSRMPSSA